ncbi:citrate synthase [Rhizobium sp. HT1-10]|uniref:citrate synthase n=1 Tax=Rhizobium sp. HT1-10 TaxID=3111638 RepID=UPI003C211923
MSWMTAEEALDLLGTKQQTLYANVSRGRIRAKADPTDTRRSLYLQDDVRRLATRQTGRRKSEAVAAETIRWGDPLLPSAVSTVSDGCLFYRGVNAIGLAEHASLEAAAAILWNTDGPLRPLPSPAGLGSDGSVQAALLALACRIAGDPPSLGRCLPDLQVEAHSVFATVAAALAPGRADLPLHQRLADGWHRPEAAPIIRRALVLFADHELNASTFAARVTTSSGASLSAATLSGLAALTGPLHGGAWRQVDLLVDQAQTKGAREAVRLRLEKDRMLPAFGHRLYPDGDARACALLAHFEIPPVFADLRAAAEALVGERANADFALSALAAAFDLPRDAPMTIFALARTVGWLAHAMEQAVSGRLIRPRARYIGPGLET